MRSFTCGHGMDVETLTSFAHLTAENLPLLEHVRVFTHALGRLINNAPALRNLHVTNNSSNTLFTSLSSVDWSLLTHLRVGEASTVAFIREIATRCTSIISLILDHHRFDSYYEPDSDDSDSEEGGSIQTRTTANPIEWQSLRNLTVTFDGSQTIADRRAPMDDNQVSRDFNRRIIETLESIRTPGLTSLEVNVRDSYDGNRVYQLAAQSTPFEGLISRSQCRINRLKIDLPRTLSVEALLRSLRPLESLQFLAIGAKFCNGHSGDLYGHRARGWCSQLFRALALPSESESEDLVERREICPELKVIEVEGCFADEATAIIDFAMSRPKLGVLKAEFGIPLPEEVNLLLASQEAVQVMREEKGMQVSWTWTEYIYKAASARTPRGRKLSVPGWW
ncbi:hypothetical protein V5O48_017432 [Marasmius crinis-equi]|uniref:Uncharacterized protein n=1 Tax=Marasmius crinis-equi TaxID=585013 RepID=A0ABR3EP02_9AGAR